MKRTIVLLLLLSLISLPGYGAEEDAVTISRNIQQRHLPHGIILDPIYASQWSDELVGYAHGGDAAIWTGHYLAAESFRYRVTHSAEALQNVKRALAGLRLLVDVTGNNLLARCAIPVGWEHAQSVLDEERRHGVYQRVVNGQNYFWFGNTSRDQYSGVFFGLSAAYEMVGDRTVRSEIKDLVTRLLDYLLDRNWFVKMPGGEISTTFTGHPDQRLNFLAIGKRVNPAFASDYNTHRFFYANVVGAAILLEVLEEHTSYFKFNLDTINLYNLIRLENDSYYRDLYLRTYNTLRNTTDDHGNAHFNMIDRALRGPDARRDQGTRELLEQWLARPRRDEWRDWRGHERYPACGADRACQPLSLADRICTDFVWQRSPFLLYGGGAGKIGGAGIDYILPYWMARFYGVLPPSVRLTRGLGN